MLAFRLIVGVRPMYLLTKLKRYRFGICTSPSVSGVGEGRKAAAEHWSFGGPIMHSTKCMLFQENSKLEQHHYQHDQSSGDLHFPVEWLQ
jgi:hypothetical protein